MQQRRPLIVEIEDAHDLLGRLCHFELFGVWTRLPLHAALLDGDDVTSRRAAIGPLKEIAFSVASSLNLETEFRSLVSRFEIPTARA